MLRRVLNGVVLLLAISACSVFSQAPPAPNVVATPVALSKTATPTGTTAEAHSTPTVGPASTLAADAAAGSVLDLPALWVIDGALNRRVALDPQTGRLLNQLPGDWTPTIVSRDGRWQYSVTSKARDKTWQVTLDMLDLTRSASPKQVLLSDAVPITTGSTREVSPGQLLLSKDERRLYVTQAQWRGEQWHTHVYVVDVRAGKLTQTAEVSTTSGTSEPPMQMVLTGDERRLLVAQNFQRQPPAGKGDPAIWFTSITVLNLDSGGVERIIDVAGDVQAHGFWLNAALAPDGKTLYLLQDIVRNSQQDGYRFVAFDLNQQAVTLTQVVERASGAEIGCGTWGLRFTAEGRYLYGYCGADHPIRPAGYVQYLDTQTGLLDSKIVLASKVNPSDPASVYGISYVLPSPDGKLLYIVSWRSREVFVFDAAQRSVVRSAVLKDTRPTSAKAWSTIFSAMANWFVGTASAKFNAQPAVLLSPDGQQLYAVDVKDFDKGDGLWAVETATLKALGHWLAGKDITGIHLSADGRELFAASPGEDSVLVLDAQSGELRRSLKPQQTTFKPMGFVTAQSN